MLLKGIKFIFRSLLKLSLIGLPQGHHITRHYLYRHLAQVMTKYRQPGKILAISGSLKLINILQFQDCEIIEANYPEYNFLNLPFPDATFDYVISDQVLEHLEGNPQQAIDQSWRILKPGGIAIHTTCFMNHIHYGPSDLWRFTPQALQYLCRNFSEIIEVGGWGNLYINFLDWLGLRYQGIPQATWHPLHQLAMLNQKDYPIITWIIARK